MAKSIYYLTHNKAPVQILILHFGAIDNANNFMILYLVEHQVGLDIQRGRKSWILIIVNICAHWIPNEWRWFRMENKDRTQFVYVWMLFALTE